MCRSMFIQKLLQFGKLLMSFGAFVLHGPKRIMLSYQLVQSRGECKQSFYQGPRVLFDVSSTLAVTCGEIHGGFSLGKRSQPCLAV